MPRASKHTSRDLVSISGCPSGTVLGTIVVHESCPAIQKPELTSSCGCNNCCTSESCPNTATVLSDSDGRRTRSDRSFKEVGIRKSTQFAPSTRTVGCGNLDQNQSLIEERIPNLPNVHSQSNRSIQSIACVNNQQFVQCSYNDSPSLISCQVPLSCHPSHTIASTKTKLKPSSATPSKRSYGTQTPDLGPRSTYKACKELTATDEPWCKKEECLIEETIPHQSISITDEKSRPKACQYNANFRENKDEISLNISNPSRLDSFISDIPVVPKKRANSIASDTSQIMVSALPKHAGKGKKKNSKTSVKGNVTNNLSEEGNNEAECSCHFPPAFSEYFHCTGHLTGQCCCLKNK